MLQRIKRNTVFALFEFEFLIASKVFYCLFANFVNKWKKYEENMNNSKQTGGATPTSKNLIVKALVKSKVKNLFSLLDFYKSDFFFKNNRINDG